MWIVPKNPEDDLVLALPSRRFTSAGPGDWWCLVHVDGFLIEIGEEKRARQIAAEINAGRAALREREEG